jgi:hypothetical protein
LTVDGDFNFLAAANSILNTMINFGRCHFLYDLSLGSWQTAPG